MRFLLGLFIMALSLSVNAQCDSWNDKSNQEQIMEWHTIYRGALKSKDYSFAEENWKKAYEAAPVADGRRASHYTDGIKIYKYKLKKEKDEAKQKEYKAMLMSLYNGVIQCYEARAIALKCSTDECYKEKVGEYKGKMGYDMYYTIDAPIQESYPVLKESLETAGSEVEYRIVAPLSYGTVSLFEEEIIEADEARGIYEGLMAAVDMKIAEGGKYVEKWKESKEIVEKAFRPIERDVFDCAFFVNKLKPEYEADPDNPEVIKLTYAYLKGQDCQDGEPFYDEVKSKWESYATERNAQLQAEFEAKNPSVKAKSLYDEGDYAGAVAKYLEAIEKEESAEKKSSYYFSIASIQFRKLNQFSDARKSALEAANLREGWGRPYLLIGDMYAKSSRNCGDDWNQRLAVLAAIEKYRKAKSVDAEVAEEANRKINIYSKSKPTQDEGFMRGKKSGDRLTVGCWIGETVTLQYQ